MGIFSWLGRGKREWHNQLVVDLHSHLIPGIDDGSASMEESLELINRFVSFGYRKLITTPHIMQDRFDNSHETIREKGKALRAAIQEANIPIELEFAAEYNLDDGFIEKIRSKDLLSFTPYKYVLFELPKFSKPCFVEQVIFEIFSAGYRPILAHPERYPYMHPHIEEFKKWREQGLLLQMNINSLTGVYSPEIKKFAEKLLKAQLVDFLGSDCHRERHLNLLESVMQQPKYQKLIAGCQIRNSELLST